VIFATVDDRDGWAVARIQGREVERIERWLG